MRTFPPPAPPAPAPAPAGAANTCPFVACQIETETVSPTPIVGLGGLPKAWMRLWTSGSGCDANADTTLLSISTRSKLRGCFAAWSITSETVGPAVGTDEQPARPDAAIQTAATAN